MFVLQILVQDHDGVMFHVSMSHFGGFFVFRNAADGLNPWSHYQVDGSWEQASTLKNAPQETARPVEKMGNLNKVIYPKKAFQLPISWGETCIYFKHYVEQSCLKSSSLACHLEDHDKP